jgi:hypothetical protein
MKSELTKKKQAGECLFFVVLLPARQRAPQL